jgi:hypothetical protein
MTIEAEIALLEFAAWVSVCMRRRSPMRHHDVASAAPEGVPLIC